MKKDKIKEVLNGMLDNISKEQVELYQSLIDKKCYENITDIEEFYFGLIYPFEEFLSGLIRSEISNNRDVVFILQHSQFIENNFVKLIEKYEGPGCCSDKSRTILKRLLDFYKNDNKIEFDYTQEYTFHLPKLIFKTHQEIVGFYEGLKNLYYGNPVKYLEELKTLTANTELSAGVQYPSIDEMALKKAREIIDKFNEFDVFCEACEMADYMVTEILDIGVVKYYHNPTSDFYVKVREHIREIAKRDGRNW